MKRLLAKIKWFFSEENNEGGLLPFLKGLCILLVCAAMIVSAFAAITTGNFLTVCGIITLIVTVFIFAKVMGWLHDNP